MSEHLYLYAITGPGGAPPGGTGGERGLLGELVYPVPYRELQALVSRASTEAAEAVAANVLCHEQIVERLMERVALLPVRFGTLLPDEERVRTLLAERYAEFTAALARVAGKVEFGVRVLSQGQPGSEPTTGPPPSAGSGPSNPPENGNRPGHRYLQARQAEHRRETVRQAEARRLADLLDATLAACAAETRCSLLLTPHLPVCAAYLVPREWVAAFEAAVAGLEATLPEYRFLCSGPWPPYNFVGAAGGSPC